MKLNTSRPHPATVQPATTCNQQCRALSYVRLTCSGGGCGAGLPVIRHRAPPLISHILKECKSRTRMRLCLHHQSINQSLTRHIQLLHFYRLLVIAQIFCNRLIANGLLPVPQCTQYNTSQSLLAVNLRIVYTKFFKPTWLPTGYCAGAHTRFPLNTNSTSSTSSPSIESTLCSSPACLVLAVFAELGAFCIATSLP
jgi:hypothetical protein